jgi:hypothetical protein
MDSQNKNPNRFNTNSLSSRSAAKRSFPRNGAVEDTDGIDIEEAMDSCGKWPRFIILEATNDKRLSDLSPFVVEKTMTGLTSAATTAKSMYSGSILVDCAKQAHSDTLLGLESFAGIPVKVSPHRSLNTCKGVVRSKDLRTTTEQEMKSELTSQNVIDVKRLSVRRGDQQVPTNTFFLTFAIAKPPQSIKVGYFNIPVEPFVPNPLRCFKCQQFGHHLSRCRRDAVCAKCSERGHDDSNCTKPVCCANCKGNHTAFSKQCPKYLLEKQVQRIKSERNISFPEARKVVEASLPNATPTRSWATIASGTQKSISTTTSSTQTDITWPFNKDQYTLVAPVSVETQTITFSADVHTSESTSKPTSKPIVPSKPNNQDKHKNKGASNMFSISSKPGKSPNGSPAKKTVEDWN